jgi:ELWxxDGT repeat protein
MISLRHSPKLAVAFAVLIAASWLLLWAPGAPAASKQRGAVLVKDISPGNPKRPGLNSQLSELTNVAGTLYFTARDRKHGDELWRSDGTRRGTRMVRDISPGRFASHTEQLTAVGKTLYFTARDGIHGRELWRSDGTARGTRIVKDINPGKSGFTGWPTDVFAHVAGTLFFVVGDYPNGALWRSDGTAAGTTLVKDFGQPLGYLTAVGRTLYFTAGDGLWRSDGTASGTVLVKGFEQQSICGATNVCYLTDVAGTLFFTASDGTQAGLWAGLWRSDGTEAGTTLVKAEISPHGLTGVGGTLYFTTIDYSVNSQLWRSDGTESGTIPVTSVGVTPEGDGPLPQLTDVGGTLYFVRNAAGGPLMSTDGTPSGTKLLRSGISPRQLTAVGKTLYFEGYDRQHGNELWRSDGTRRGTRLVSDIKRGERSSSLLDLTAVGKTLFFIAIDDAHGRELWRAGAKPCKKAKGKCKKR